MNYRAKRHARLVARQKLHEVTWAFFLKNLEGFAVVCIDHSQLTITLDIVNAVAYDPSPENVMRLRTHWATVSSDVKSFMNIPDLRDDDPTVDEERMMAYNCPIA